MELTTTPTLPSPFVLEENVVVKLKKKRATSFTKWEMKDLLYVSAVLLMHVLCLFAPFTFNWNAFWLGVVHYILCGLFGVTLCYHRGLSHGSFKLPKYLEYLFAYFGMLALQGDPIFWVSTHRYHHKFTDTEADPHSPVEGFWFSHMGWIFDDNYLVQKGENYVNVGDLVRQRYYRFLETTVVIHVYLHAALLYMLGGFPFVVWGKGVSTVWGYHVTFSVNSVCHIWGHQAWNTGDLSKNNWFVALFTFGEGWHNNHHAFEFSARHGLEWWQLDTTWYVIKLLEHFGLATNVKVPSKIHKHKKSLKNRMDDMKPQTDVKMQKMISVDCSEAKAYLST
ncbi:hypothetical protein IFM89_027603 [Coptis chinensis]|uniref:Fatty acid desaturase domain-containing protein n=1 Tax=Coptis chinensis TaxID=261450 RepID=A0A835IQW8_9MAGN|nr:hypothetical protein IFM89_027603 [Coptis chinensis]